MFEVIARSAVVFTVAFFGMMLFAVVADEPLKNALKPEAYTVWHRSFKDYKAIFSTLTFFSLVIVGLYWSWGWLNPGPSAQDRAIARICLHYGNDSVQCARARTGDEAAATADYP